MDEVYNRAYRDVFTACRCEYLNPDDAGQADIMLTYVLLALALRHKPARAVQQLLELKTHPLIKTAEPEI